MKKVGGPLAMGDVLGDIASFAAAIVDISQARFFVPESLLYIYMYYIRTGVLDPRY